MRRDREPERDAREMRLQMKLFAKPEMICNIDQYILHAVTITRMYHQHLTATVFFRHLPATEAASAG